jgi:hypothetical protein
MRALQQYDLVRNMASSRQLFSLLSSVREAVQHPALRLTVRVLQPLKQQLHEEMPRHCFAAVHVSLGLQA